MGNMTNWISVKKKTADNTVVLVSVLDLAKYIGDAPESPARRREVRTALWDKEEGWIISYGDEDDFVIEAWMPLPEPYEEGRVL